MITAALGLAIHRLDAKVRSACKMSGLHGAMQSLLDEVDLEDLGMHCMDKTMQEHKDVGLPEDTTFPAWLKDYCKVKGFSTQAILILFSCCSAAQHLCGGHAVTKTSSDLLFNQCLA